MGNWFTDTLGEALDGLDAAQQWARRNDPFGGWMEALGSPSPIRIHSGGVELFGGDWTIGQSREGGPEPVRSRSDLNPPQWVTSSTEQFFAGYEYVYSNYISQPLSTAILMAYRPGEILSASEWSRTWTAAEHISPGQAYHLPYAEGDAGEQLAGWLPATGVLTALGIGPGDADLVDQAVDSPLRLYEPPAAMLPPEWENLSDEERQQILAEAGMPVDPAGGNQFIHELRERSSGFRRHSGVADFAVRWFADPLIIGGKAFQAVRRRTTQPRRPKGGWSQGDIEKLVTGSRMNQLIDFVWANRDNPALVNNTDMALKSAMGPRLGAVASVLTSKSEVQDFIRVGMGDVAAQVRLGEANALARQRLEGHMTRLSQQQLLAANYTGKQSGAMRALAQKEIERLQKAVDADDALVRRYEAILEHADEFDRLYLNRTQFRAAQNRTEAQREYLAGPARDGARQFRRKATPPIAPVGREVIPVQSGFHATRLWGVGDAFAIPVNVIRSVKNMHPNGYMNLDNGSALAKESVNELRAQIARIPGLSVGQRHNMLNEYLKLTSEGARKEWLDDMSRLAWAKLAEKHGISDDVAREIYEASRLKRQGVRDDMAQFSAARDSEQPGALGRVDYFEAEGGIKIRPNTVSRLVNSYVLDDLAAVDRVLKSHGKMFETLRAGHGGHPGWVNAADSLNQLWKFSVLFRLGYIPRTVGDDLMGQVATLGAKAMAMRVGYGIKNAVTNFVHRDQEALNRITRDVRLEEVKYADEAIAEARSQLDQLGPGAPAGRTSALKAQIQQLEHFKDLAQRSAKELEEPYQKAIQGRGEVRIDGVTFPGAFSGQRGDYYMKQISGDKAYDQLFKSSRQMLHTHLQRSFDHGARPIDAIDDAAQHATAWAHAINAQIAGDAMERMLVQGVPEERVVRWLKRDPAGRAYWKRLGLKRTPPEEVVAKARFEVDEYLPTPEIRAQALTEEGVTPEFLTKAIPNAAHRPTVHMANVGQSYWTGYRALDKIMQGFYDLAVNTPANRMSRHPLFNQLYEGHLKQIVAQRTKQGAAPRTVEEVEKVTETSRRLALRDMKNLVFDITHRSDAAMAMRFISPFFAATAESFQRWGRIIADKPEVVGYAAKFYNAPAYLGHMQTWDGHQIYADGTYIDPLTGERKLAKKGDRWIVARMPKWFVDSPLGVAFGVERSSGKMMLSQNSMNVVTQGDPWFNPGVGPIVAIPAQEWVKDKPDQAELARHLGILPFGPSGDPGLGGRVADAVTPATVRHFLTAFDTSDWRYQQVKMQITQRAIFEHEEGGKPMLSEREIADRVRSYWLFSAGSAFLQPMATRRQDAYQFWRDQYNLLRQKDHTTADIEFLDRFGEEYFVFAQQTSRHKAGLPASRQAVELSQQYADLLAESPELGSLIIGPEGNGPFSPEAYTYQLNQPLEPGGAEAQRLRLSAAEVMEENQRRLGWAKYTQFMNWANNQLVQRNLTSLDEEGAEDLALARKAWIAMHAEPTTPTGEENPYYNEQWSSDWFSFDARKYERMIPKLERIAEEGLRRDPERGDLRTLQVYLAMRQTVRDALAERPFKTLGARANRDLRAAWTVGVGRLVESNTDFGDLHSRYLARDMGIDMDEESEVLAMLEEAA